MLKLLNGDIEADGLKEITQGLHIDMVFTDPPWNPGIAKMFRAWAGSPRQVQLEALFASLARNLKLYCGDAVVYIMMGSQGINALVSAFSEEQFILLNCWPCLWRDKSAKKNNQFNLYRFSLYNHPVIHAVPENGDTRKLVRWAIAQEKPKCILDPFVGHGAVVDVALETGVDVLGQDINERFLSIIRRRHADIRD